jgi:hypothetical protein
MPPGNYSIKIAECGSILEPTPFSLRNWAIEQFGTYVHPPGSPPISKLAYYHMSTLPLSFKFHLLTPTRPLTFAA